MSDKPNPAALVLLNNMARNFDSYDISTFKSVGMQMLELADDRPAEDRTDFSFMERRKDDKENTN